MLPDENIVFYFQTGVIICTFICFKAWTDQRELMDVVIYEQRKTLIIFLEIFRSHVAEDVYGSIKRHGTKDSQ